MLVDPFGRSINYLRLSLTDRCNLRCAYCLPASGVRWLPREDLLDADEIVRVAEAAAGLGVDKIRLTGGEPLVRPDALEIVRRLAAIPGIRDLSLTTNAILLEKMAKPLAEAGLKRVNISLDTLDADKFRRVTRFGDFSRAWEGILAAEAAGLTPLKLNTVVVGGFNADELPALARLTLDHPWHIRFIELMPVGNRHDWGEGFPAPAERYIPVQEMKAHLETWNLEPETPPTGNGPARTFRIPGAIGTVGFISPLGEHFCDTCNRLRLTADGRLRACLLMDGEISIRSALRLGQPLEPLLAEAVRRKPRGHELAQHRYPEARRMAQIGG
ncbi:MAG: GTP 3',8-cyclase MoaA [Chloroflexota bacterium]